MFVKKIVCWLKPGTTPRGRRIRVGFGIRPTVGSRRSRRRCRRGCRESYSLPVALLFVCGGESCGNEGLRKIEANKGGE